MLMRAFTKGTYIYYLSHTTLDHKFCACKFVFFPQRDSNLYVCDIVVTPPAPCPSHQTTLRLLQIQLSMVDHPFLVGVIQGCKHNTVIQWQVDAVPFRSSILSVEKDDDVDYHAAASNFDFNYQYTRLNMGNFITDISIKQHVAIYRAKTIKKIVSNLAKQC